MSVYQGYSTNLPFSSLSGTPDHPDPAKKESLLEVRSSAAVHCKASWADILESKVKWALESITTNKASGGDGIPVELFQILKDDAVKVLHSICQQMWKTHQWPQDWKRSVFIPIPKKGPSF